MMRLTAALGLLLTCRLAMAESPVALACSADGIVVAHGGRDGRTDIFDRSGRRILWTAAGVANPSIITLAAGGGRVAIADPLENRIQIIETTTHTSRRFDTGETPVGVAFDGSDLIVLSRDDRRLERISPEGKRRTLDLPPDPAFLGVSGSKAYVYSRITGSLQEISLPRMETERTFTASSSASAMAVDGETAYLLFPRIARIEIVNLRSFASGGMIPTGAVPVGMTLGRKGTGLSPRVIEVADPSAKRIWFVDGAQSLSAAVARGFLRGVIGLGLFASQDASFPTGVDVVASDERASIAYDSSSGALYRYREGGSRLLASNVGPRAFTVCGGRIVYWQLGKIAIE